MWCVACTGQAKSEVPPPCTHRGAAPVVVNMVYPHSVFELSAVLILAWSGVGCLDFCMCHVPSQFIVRGGDTQAKP